MKRLALLTFAVATLVLAFAQSAAADRKLVVDKDKAQCRNAKYTSIQAAVTAAGAGDTIVVCPDTYNEHVTIATPAKNGLTLKAKGPPGSVVVDGANTLMHGFELTDVSGVLITGFLVKRYHDDIWLNPSADGNTIRHNVTTEAWDHDGIVVQGDRNLIEHNLSFGNPRPIGCGISLGTGASNNLVRHNEVHHNPNTGILLGGGILGPAGLGNRIVHNRSHDNGKPVPGVAAGTGILNANSPGALIAHNDVYDNNGNGIAVAGALSRGVIVELNRSRANGRSGIEVVGGASGNTLRHNDVRLNTLDGISLVNGDSNTIARNHSRGNGRDGIRADSASAGNVISRNHMRRNREHDCHDDSVGAGTAGTANVWIKNKGRTENRPGLCKGKKG
jgi:parallel beta-helix repeat protein